MLSEDSFILPTFQQLQQIEIISEEPSKQEDPQIEMQQIRKERQLAYNHYAGCSKVFDVEIEPIH